MVGPATGALRYALLIRRIVVTFAPLPMPIPRDPFARAASFDVETGEQHWISGPRRDGADRLYGERIPVEVDEDAYDEYWSAIRRRAL
jgi:hypothetical protein